MSRLQALILCLALSALAAAPSAALAQTTGARHHKHSAHGHAPRASAARPGAAGAVQGSRQIYMAPAVGVPPIGSTMPEAPVNTLPAGQGAPICGAGPYPACN